MEEGVKQEIVSLLINKGILIDRGALNYIESLGDPLSFHRFLISDSGNESDFMELFKRYVIFTKDIQDSKELSENIISSDEKNSLSGSVNILFSYENEPKKRVVQDFTGFFTSRYNKIKSILMNRKELQNLTSINRLAQKKGNERVAIIGIVSEKNITKTGKYIFTVEDTTGSIKIIVSENSDSFDVAKDTVLDEVIGITGSCSGQVIFANNIILPDIPVNNEFKKSPDETYALFIGDCHFGSKVFLHDAFNKLISWIKGEYGDDRQKEISSKLKYIFVTGDLVEGVGIYPGQENDLDIPDIYNQYEEFARYIKNIPSHIKIIICPGNHDAMRIAEPQPPLYKDFAAAVWNIPNVVMVSSPSYVNIHKSEGFPGFDVLLYHGYSFIYYADMVDFIRSAGGQERVDLIMKFLLQRRHLAPSHKSTLYLPDADKDSLVIDKIPDIFASGHIHRVSVANYKGVSLLNCSCWLETTEFQDKMGLHPQPGRAILMNLQTRNVKILKFYDGVKK